MAPPLLTLQNVALTLGGKPLISSADLSVERGDRICLVGRNGSGKSTLLKIAAGEIEPDGGARFFQPDATVRYLPQEPDLSGFPDVHSFVVAGLGPSDADYRAHYLLDALGLTGSENPKNLSGGEARRAALARALAPQPDILLLDEPTNHLDLPAIEWLESELAGLRSALVIISHDRRFLQNLSRSAVWLDRGATKRLDRGFGEFESWRDAVLEQEERDAQKLDRKIVAEEHWVRYGVTARRKRNVRRMSELGALREARRTATKAVGEVKISVAEGLVSGKLVVEAEKIAKSYDDRPIVKGLSLRMLRGDRLALVGPNGAGKTTLINLLTGVLPPDSGSVRLGANLQMATLDQRRAALDPNATLADTLTGGGSDWVEINGERKHVIGYMKDFLFPPEQARTPTKNLSGGERARLLLARALAQPSNFLVLDEPTNDLDLETLDLLQETLSDYPGTLLLVSHDRDFIDRVAGSVIASEGDGAWVEYAGGYSDMLRQRGAGLTLTPARNTPEKKLRRADPRPAAEVKRRLSFSEKHALETLPAQIEHLRAKAAKLHEILHDHDLYARDPKRFADATALLAKVEAEFAAAEDRWLELEILREELNG
ncbi:elongation factor 3 [Rhodoblastus sphagnicola]|uniref:ATP-binding protein Uup n=1 Tax=Rhodoblastus sphagnicola TaxID=333368 RepID=A0A2S6MUE9_9HYPH|nr:ATP-binding cassette domain-containing protein [Rhodoblastus sphagnicola]MBB4197003.1 ATP-binding cassette subfamily F protein uup [Rhodoblastus sphagnicola]PPQ25990.1 elongation factor 3 [Rhodoblastus sphagnicola]